MPALLVPERLRAAPLAVPKERFLPGEHHLKAPMTGLGLPRTEDNCPKPGAREGRGLATPRSHASRLRLLATPLIVTASLAIGQPLSRGVRVVQLSREFLDVCKKCGRKCGLFPRRRDVGRMKVRPGPAGAALGYGGWSSPAVNDPGAARRAAVGGQWSVAAGLERSRGADGSGLLAGPAPLVAALPPQGCGAPGFRSSRLAWKDLGG